MAGYRDISQGITGPIAQLGTDGQKTYGVGAGAEICAEVRIAMDECTMR